MVQSVKNFGQIIYLLGNGYLGEEINEKENDRNVACCCPCTNLPTDSEFSSFVDAKSLAAWEAFWNACDIASDFAFPDSNVSPAVDLMLSKIATASFSSLVSILNVSFALLILIAPLKSVM